MNKPLSPSDQSQFVKEYAARLIQNKSNVYSNVDQDIIIITEDKIRLCLIEHLPKMEKKKGWITPTVILLTILTVFTTTTFHEFLGLSSEVWKALFLFVAVASVIWLIRACLDLRATASLDDVVADIKQTGIVQAESQPQLTINSATYGAEGITKDVTQILSSRVSKGTLEINVSNEDLGGDPYPAKLKELTVDYTYAGQKLSKAIREREKLILP